MKKILSIVTKAATLAVTAGWLASSASAASTRIAYQGQLREQGVPVTANKSMAFRIFTASTGSSAVWSSGNQTIPVIGGLFRTLLEPTGVNWETTLYVEVEVDGTTLSPREELTASPFAINAQLLAGKAYTSAGAAPSSPAAGDFWFNTGGNTLNVWSGAAWDQVSSGGTGGGTVAIEQGDTGILSGAGTIDFSGTFFTVTSGPSGEANVAIAGNAITDAQISASAGIQLSKLEKDPSQAGTLNTSTNPVDWSQLKNVPATFADGVDNTGAGSPVIEEGETIIDAAAISFDFLGAHFNVTSQPAGEANISLDASSVTLMGNAFNGNSQLVQLTASGQLPTVSGVNLTNLTGANLIGTVPNTTLDTSSVTKQGNVFNGNNQLVQINGSGQLPVASGANLTNLTAANLTGTVPNATLDPSSVTKQGNTFNGSNQLVKLDGTGQLTISGWATIAKHLSATKSVDFGATAAGTCDADTIGVAGAEDGDVVSLGIPNALAASDTGQVFYGYVSSSGVVTVRRCNPCAVLGCTALTNPAAATVRVDVWKH